mgnify:FL=1
MKYILLLFLPSICLAGGVEYYLPSPDGGCFEVSDEKTSLAKAEADFINHRKEYRLIPVSDQLYLFNQCNLGKAYCYKVPAVCGKSQRFDIWMWGAK